VAENVTQGLGKAHYDPKRAAGGQSQNNQSRDEIFSVYRKMKRRLFGNLPEKYLADQNTELQAAVHDRTASHRGGDLNMSSGGEAQKIRDKRAPQHIPKSKRWGKTKKKRGIGKSIRRRLTNEKQRGHGVNSHSMGPNGDGMWRKLTLFRRMLKEFLERKTVES